MTTIRRVYAYLLTFAGLAILSVAAANLGQLLIDVALQPGQSSASGAVRDGVAQNAAAAVVGLVAWLAHWTWITRTARRDPSERASILRRLFVYAVLTGSMLVLAGALHDTLRAAFDV